MIQGSFKERAKSVYDFVCKVYSCKNDKVLPIYVTAIIGVESSFRPDVIRYEPVEKLFSIMISKARAAEWKKRIKDNGWSEVEIAASYGLGQLLPVTVWDMGWYFKNPRELLNCNLNIFYTCCLFDKLLKFSKNDFNKAISFYNTGVSAKFYNENYVNKVLKMINLIKTYVIKL